MLTFIMIPEDPLSERHASPEEIFFLDLLPLIRVNVTTGWGSIIEIARI